MKSVNFTILGEQSIANDFGKKGTSTDLTLYDRNLNGRAFIMRALLAGALLGYANTSWGGSLFFNVVFTTVLVFTPFIASTKA